MGRDAERPLHLRGDALERVIQLPQPLEEIERLTQPMHVAKAYHSVIGYPTIATGSPAAGHHDSFEMFRRRSAGSVGMEIAQAGIGGRRVRVLISGAGLAGLSLAFGLTRGGHAVVVVEQAPSLRDAG